MDQDNQQNIPPENGGEPDNFEVGQGPARGANAGGEGEARQEGQEPGLETRSETRNPTDDISRRLSEAEGAGAEQREPDAPEAEAAVPIDLSKLSREQLQTLKSLLAATPEASQRKKQKPRVTLRRMNNQIIIDFKNAYLGLVKDNELNRDVERQLIRVRFLGDPAEKYQTITFRDFINLERVPCEIVSTRTEEDPIVEGETVSRETGGPVEMVRKEVKHWFTIKLPEGSEPATIEIEGRIANG